MSYEFWSLYRYYTREKGKSKRFFRSFLQIFVVKCCRLQEKMLAVIDF